jgi:hypothetical protein
MEKIEVISCERRGEYDKPIKEDLAATIKIWCWNNLLPKRVRGKLADTKFMLWVMSSGWKWKNYKNMRKI